MDTGGSIMSEQCCVFASAWVVTSYMCCWRPCLQIFETRMQNAITIQVFCLATPGVCALISGQAKESPAFSLPLPLHFAELPSNSVPSPPQASWASFEDVLRQT